jgi:hypothetical protein
LIDDGEDVDAVPLLFIELEELLLVALPDVDDGEVPLDVPYALVPLVPDVFALFMLAEPEVFALPDVLEL